MRLTRRDFMTLGATGFGISAGRRLFASGPPGEQLLAPASIVAQNVGIRSAAPRFELVQPDLFAVAGAQPNAWADFNGDGNLDLFVGFKADVANRLYRYDGHTFTDVAKDLGLADLTDTRAAAWGDFDADGRFDLYVGFTRRSGAANKLYRYDGSKFTDIAHDLGIDAKGETRQVSWIDFDNDGKIDLFVAFRDAPNMLFHNEGNRFVDVAGDMGVADPRKTVGAVWFDFNEDGRLDLFTANQDGTLNGLYRNDGTKFVDVAHELGMDAAGRPENFGSNGPSVIDYDNDGRLDLFVAGYGRNFLYHNEGGGKFKDVAEAMGIRGGDKATPSAWGDYDNDGRPDLYVSSYIDKPLNEHDFLYHNDGARFVDAMPELIAKHGATHGVQWVDFDGDGALDLALANNNPSGGHYLFRNLLPTDQARQSIQVLVVDANRRHTRAGSEIRVYAAGTRTLLGARLVDTGSGYCSQSIAPVHIGVGGGAQGAARASNRADKVDVEVTSMTKSGRKLTRVTGVDPNKLPKRTLVVRASATI